MNRKTFLILLVSFVQSLCLLKAQTTNTNILSYLVNPTVQEQKMLEGMTLDNIDKAIALYEKEKMLFQYRSLSAEVQARSGELATVRSEMSETMKGIDSIRTMVLNEVQLLRMTGKKGDADHALSIMKSMIDINPSDISLMKPYLDIKLQTYEYDECDRVLKMFEANCNDEFDLARIHQNMGTVAYNRNHLREAISLFESALAVYNKYIEQEGWGYKNVCTFVMYTYNLLSQIYNKLQDRDTTILYMNNVLRIGDLAVRYDQVDGPVFYASAIVGMANKYKAFGMTEKADSIYNVAFKYIEPAYREAPFRHGSIYAFYHMNHARDFMAEKKYAEAVPFADRAVEVLGQMYETLPDWSRINYFESKRLRAELYSATDEFEKAQKMFAEAEELLLLIDRVQPGGNEIRSFNLYYSMALNEASMDNFAKSETLFVKAKTVVENLEPRLRDPRVAICDKYIELLKKELEKK